jgi:hypothetical protein
MGTCQQCMHSLSLYTAAGACVAQALPDSSTDPEEDAYSDPTEVETPGQADDVAWNSQGWDAAADLSIPRKLVLAGDIASSWRGLLTAEGTRQAKRASTSPRFLKDREDAILDSAEGAAGAEAEPAPETGRDPELHFGGDAGSHLQVCVPICQCSLKSSALLLRTTRSDSTESPNIYQLVCSPPQSLRL